jgi:hypothetical protein
MMKKAKSTIARYLNIKGVAMSCSTSRKWEGTNDTDEAPTVPSKYGAFVSYLATTQKEMERSFHNMYYPFLNISLGKIGLETFLLRAVHMLQVCMGYPPRLEMQVCCNSL